MRRIKKRLFALFCATLAFWLFENYTFRVCKTIVHCARMQTPVRIALLSDLHGQKFGSDNHWLIRCIRAENPDIICATGDMFTNGDWQGCQSALQLFSALTAIAPVYFVPGEHDRAPHYINALRQSGIHVLWNTWEDINVGDETLRMYGIANAYFPKNFSLKNIFGETRSDRINVLLAHIPRPDIYTHFGADLVLCGDTHGGIVRLPFLGPLQIDGVWLPKLRNIFSTDLGLYSLERGNMYVTSGLGNYPYPLRLFNRPEIVFLTIAP